MGLFDASIPSDSEAVKLGASRIRNLESALNAVLGIIFNDDSTFKLNVIPGSAIEDGTVTFSKLDPVTVNPLLQVPTGTVVMFAAAPGSPPTNWLYCDGSNYDGTNPTYAALYARIGTSYGNSGGASHFNVPDFRGRAPVAPDVGQGRTPSISAIGVAAGESTHPLTIGELAAHSHATFIANTDSSTANPLGSGNTLAINASGTPAFHGTTTPATVGIATSASVGSGTPHNNVQPSLGINFLIRL